MGVNPIAWSVNKRISRTLYRKHLDSILRGPRKGYLVLRVRVRLPEWDIFFITTDCFSCSIFFLHTMRIGDGVKG